MAGSTDKTHAEKIWYLLEDRQRFSQSALWTLQRSYFQSAGIEAWRQGVVPSYVTSNPTTANAYAEIVFAFLQDRRRLAPGNDEPLHLCELGGGSGRLAFHLLSRLRSLCDEAGMAFASFRYVLTDFAQSNIDFWLDHPRFAPFFASGVLDVACFDVTRDDTLDLQHSGHTIAAGDLAQPLVVLANYVFDSLPQELYTFHQGTAHRCLISLRIDREPNELSAAGLIAGLSHRYDVEELAEIPYGDDEAGLRRLFREYQEQLADSHVLFPDQGLRGLDRLHALSRSGSLVLSADKGSDRLEALDHQPPPLLIHHGSFSLNVNFHALRRFCELYGGLALSPASPAYSMLLGCLLRLPQAAEHRLTRLAYRRHVQDFGPDDFFTILQHTQKQTDSLTFQDLLAYLRLGGYDSQQFLSYLPRLMKLSDELTPVERQMLGEAVERVWSLHFPLGEDGDLANAIAGLFYALDDYPRALVYFERSIEIYGRDSGTLYNMAVCRRLMDDQQASDELLREVLRHDPGNRAARDLLNDPPEKA